MEGFRMLPGHGTKPTRDDDDTDSGSFISRKRTNHDQPRPHPNSKTSSASAHIVQTLWKPLSFVDGAAVDGEALAKFGVYRDLESSDADNSIDDDFDDSRPLGGRTTRLQTDSNPARENHTQTSALPQLRISTLLIFNYAQGSHVVEPEALTLVCRPLQELQSARPLNPVMNSRMNMMDGPNMDGRGDPFQMSDFPLWRSQAPSPSPTLGVNTLDAVAPAQQKKMCGELLHTKIREQQPELTGKITGMLLDMDNAELLDLAANDAALRNKVNEAMCIYNDYLKSQSGGSAAFIPKGSVNNFEYIPASREQGNRYRKARHRSLRIKEPPRNKESPPEVHVSTLPVVDYNKIIAVFEPGSSDPLFRSYQGLQLGEHLERVKMCPRLDNMDVEGGKLYLAQTLQFHYRLQISYPLHETREGKSGHRRHVSGKKQDPKPQSRTWSCTSQPDHYLTNTEYIKLVKAQLPHKVFTNVAEELIRQLRSKQCLPRRHNDPAQADDFDFHGIVPYVVIQ